MHQSDIPINNFFESYQTTKRGAHMEIKQLKSFVTVAKTSSFSKTAHILNFAQSSISDQIHSLEEELNCKLFERLGRNISLTKEGEQLLEYANKILVLSSKAKQVLNNSSTPTGTLTIATAETLGVYFLPNLITKYCKLYPDVEIKLIVGKCEEFTQWIRSNKADVAFTYDHFSKDKDLLCKNLTQEPLVIVSAPILYPQNQKHVDLFDLNGKNFVITQKECSYRLMFEELLLSIGATPNSVLELESVEAIKRYVISGFGITFLPRIAVEDELKSGVLIEWNYKGFGYQSTSQILFHKDKWLSPAFKALLKLSCEVFVDSDLDSSQINHLTYGT
jgi:DNA-binding transcriptional LysR family regulator